MSGRSEVLQILNGNNIQKNIDEILDSDDKFRFMESLRQLAIERRKLKLGSENSNKLVIQLIDAESESILNQYKLIETALESTLKAENRLDSLKKYSRPDNPDLPEDPKSLKDPKIAFRYALMRQYRRQFEVTINEQKDGAWPLLVNDLLEPIDGKRKLLIEAFPNAASIHNSTDFLNGFSSAQAALVKGILQDVQADIAQRLANSIKAQQLPIIQPTGKIDTIVKIIKKLYDWTEKLITTVEAYRLAKEVAEKAQEMDRERQEKKSREEWERFNSNPQPIEGSSDHVDRFDRNHDIIRGAC